jgi:5-methylthioribose kinase
MSAYHPLDEAEAIELAKSLPDLFAPDAGLICQEIGDGNLNLVFRVIDPHTNKSIIMKQALPYAKVVGESWPLTLDRARIESDALQIQASLCADLVPKVYSYRPELALTIMEDLSDHTIMRKGLIEGNVYPDFAEHIADFMARTLFFTSDLSMNQQDKKERVKQFINPELCKITEDLIFDHPFTDADTNDFNPAIKDAVEHVWNDEELHLQVAVLRNGFLTNAQAMLHGDLHTGSIFVTSASTKVIDPEFAFYGPMGFDVGAVIANLLLNYVGQEGWIDDSKEREDYRLYLLQTTQDVWNRFEGQFRGLWKEHLADRMFASPGYLDLYMQRLFQDTIGYAGCKMVRRIIGLAHVADIHTIPDSLTKERAERLALQIGTQLIKHHQKASSISEVVDIVQQSMKK